MNIVTLHVDKAKVWEEVAKTSNYTGGKSDDENDLDKVMLTEADKKAWESFWDSAVATANGKFKDFLLTASTMGEDYDPELELSSSYDTNLTDSVNADLFTFFVSSIVAQWYKFCAKAEADDFARKADGAMLEALRKIYSKRKPQRPQRTVRQ